VTVYGIHRERLQLTEVQLGGSGKKPARLEARTSVTSVVVRRIVGSSTMLSSTLPAAVDLYRAFANPRIRAWTLAPARSRTGPFGNRRFPPVLGRTRGQFRGSRTDSHLRVEGGSPLESL